MSLVSHLYDCPRSCPTGLEWIQILDAFGQLSGSHESGVFTNRFENFLFFFQSLVHFRFLVEKELI